MGLSNNPGQYADVKEILDGAIAQGGGVYTLDSTKSAYRWRARAYQLRKLLLEHSKEQCLPGMLPSTPYDTVYLQIKNNEVVITLVTPKGKLTTLNGETPAPKEDDLVTQAKRLAEELMNE